MASSLFINTVHVCFESVLAMDNAEMVVMFESLVDTGLKGFLGCPAVIHEAALLEFLANGSVRDGLVVSTVNGVTVEISEQLFAETFELPVEGLTDLSEIHKDLVFDARSIVSLSGEPVSMSGKKKELAIEFRLLCDILAKTISVKVGSFDAITQEKFLMMAAITCGVRINWNRLLFNIFKDMVTPGSRQAKGYAIQISMLLENVTKLGTRRILGVSFFKTEPRVKKTPVKRAASKKRPATDADAERVVKKKRTTKNIEVLVMLREQIIDEVDKFFNSFSLKRLATLKIDESYFNKEALILSWAETDSTRVALNRKTYILTKYRELLIRKFLEARKINFTPGEGSSATDPKVMEMLSDLHWFAVEELKEQTMAHGLKWEKTCCSKIFEGRPRDRGVVIAKTNTNTHSTCWIRTMIRVDGVWVIEPCGDHWVKIPREVVNNEILRQISYVDTLPPVSDFFRVMRKCWADVCMEVSQFVVSDRLLPVDSVNFCRTLAVVEPVSDSVSRQSSVTVWGWSQLCTTFIRYSLFSSLSTADIRSFVSTIAFERTVFRDVQIAQSSVFAISSVQSSFASADSSYVQLLLDQRPQSPSTTAESSMHFVEDDIQLEDDSALDHFISTSSATAVATSIDALRESFSNFVATQSKDSRQTNNALGEVMNKIDHVKRVFLDSIAEHNETFWGLFKCSRQDAQNDNNALSLALKAVRNQNVILSTDLEATRKEVRDMKAALSKDVDDKLADIRNELLEFRVETRGQLASLGTQLEELIAFLTKDSDDKKGEGGVQPSQSVQSSHPPQQQVAQQSGHHRFRPRGRQFKKKFGFSSSGSGSSSSGSSSKVEFCGQCGGKHPTTQCVGMQGSCDVCEQYGHFARVCPLSGSQHTAAPP
ncbi:hypothetical protein F511_31267 [Dorcoceras hygrometricum]|uniref:CCHC-type domain-containing protein n=1 Tax=Dorcoceras hygrometricum TaxID=472368 RepID=A0A2Z7BXQ7_9LAMI|nr:hypothetical protein F511_31267 [Dorcoceras hygrometricum]